MHRQSSTQATTQTTPVVSVSVAICTLDRPDALARCLASLTNGSAHPSDVVVVDQSSTASARPVVEDVNGRLNVEYLVQRATGLGIGQNEAVRHTRSPVVAVLDDDCVADERWIAEVARLLDAASPVDVVGGRVLPLDDGGTGRYPVSSRTSTTARGFRDRARPWDVGSGNNFALRREWFDRVGGCNERLGPGSPGRGAVDMDLFYRLLRAGARARYEPQLLVYHERKTRGERLARRVPYGYGMGAACATWLRQRDWYALRVLAAWLLLRSKLLVGAVRRRRWLSAWEEMLVLGGTARGLAHGFLDTRSAR
jgi:GT2 family glycosyltransferase